MNQHSKTAIHAKNERQIRCSKPTTKDQILNAEILQALNMVDKNHSFSSANGDSDRFKKIFLDLQIAAKYSQEETKSEYVVQFGLAPFAKDELITDVQKTPSSFKFDETTNFQVKKQYDGYVTYFLKEVTQSCNIILWFLACWSLYG